MKDQLKQHSGGVGGMAAIMWLFNEVGSIEGLEPLHQAILKLIIFVIAAALVIVLRRMPAEVPPKPQPKPPN